ncbi:unnamed protein product, partial [Brugia timori]|uniref:CCHC-type domain-containing protein n=1 Tax=Brugia timori TaxID=42155 RepID=A0A0R3QBY7_9BILA
MSEHDKRDAYYQVMSKVIPSIKEATYRDIAKGQGEGYNFEELRRYVQRFEAENKPLLQNRNRAGAMMAGPDALKRDRCFNCGVMGHISTQCRRKRGDTMCYVCLKFGHRSFQCPLNNPGLGNENRFVKRPSFSRIPAAKRFRGSFRPNNNRRGIMRGMNIRGGTRRGFGNRRGNFTQPGGNQQFYYNTNRQNNVTRGGNMRGRGRGRGNMRGYSQRNINNPPNNSRVDNSRTGVSSRNTPNQGPAENKPAAPQVNVVLPSLLDVTPFGFTENELIKSLIRDKECSYAGDKLDDSYMLLTPYQMDDEVIVKHVVYRYGQWWLNQTSYESELSDRERDVERRQAGNEMRRGSLKKQDEERTYHYPESSLRNLKGYPTRRDDDDEAGAGGCAMMARGHSRSRHRGEGEIYVCSNAKEKRPFILTKVKYSPDISENLLSFRRFTEMGYVIELNSVDMKIYEPPSNSGGAEPGGDVNPLQNNQEAD